MSLTTSRRTRRQATWSRVRAVFASCAGCEADEARAATFGKGEKADLSKAERNELAKLVQVLKGYAKEGR